MWELRDTVSRLMRELGWSQADLVRAMKASNRFYPIYESEVSKYLSGQTESPKAHRTMEDALKLMTKELDRRNRDLEEANRVLRHGNR